MEQWQRDFIEQMMPYAARAGAATGVDPRIIAAQAAVESGYGKSAPGGNYFGIKSHGAPGGQTLSTTEVGPNGAYTTKASFAQHGGMGQSADAYAEFINKNPRYGALKSAEGVDAQLAELQKSGYATDPRYSEKVGAVARNLSPFSAAAPSEGGGLLASKFDASPSPVGFTQPGGLLTPAVAMPSNIDMGPQASMNTTPSAYASFTQAPVQQAVQNYSNSNAQNAAPQGKFDFAGLAAQGMKLMEAGAPKPSWQPGAPAPVHRPQQVNFFQGLFG
ncbi:FlgJ Muramidase (flagellum-specific) [uncultured Caudovirales phage]|uniref:FlgJ Muramidase (Flagellum-specific) n=1 Tax=uncultured Caudovirales phage TaxID=2100421 RepID=A0A6J5KTN8_9CAUD|nr:FlgJ Muramidase (flagellum-specific) [uncultured Caudovirales phage]